MACSSLTNDGVRRVLQFVKQNAINSER